MPLPPHPGVFTTVERRCAEANPTPELRLVDAPSGRVTSLPLRQARQMLYDRSADPDCRTVLWHQIAERARWDSARSDWPTAVVWLGLPGLRRTAVRIVRSSGAERDDVEAELVTCYLEALAQVGPHTPDPGGQVLRSACTNGWARWRTARRETAVADVESGRGLPAGTHPRGGWEADYAPPANGSGLSAGLRFTVPADRVEGVRLGALAQAWGLGADGTRYSGRGRQVASLSLRRAGRKG
ncbi:hypothetical protein ABTX35_13680 [Streptomyces sp. NPDC096080]|uniref:hypothetical protein n=1 Tax=Streptomyces sp. NPDC096080 TaxID=3156693 RepID=UPI003330F7D0